MLHDYFTSLSDYLKREHEKMHQREKKNIQMLQNRGELSEERKTENDNAQKAYDKLLTNTNTLAVNLSLFEVLVYIYMCMSLYCFLGCIE